MIRPEEHPLERGLKSFNFSKIQSSSITKKILRHNCLNAPRKWYKKIAKLIRPEEHPLERGLKSLNFSKIQSSSINKKILRHNCLNAPRKWYKKLPSWSDQRNIPWRGGWNRWISPKFKVRRLPKKFYGKIAWMHPGNDIKNCRADPTRGTSPGEGVEIVEFLQNSKFFDYQNIFLAHLLNCTYVII